MAAGEYVQVFRANLFDGEVLIEIVESDLISDFGMQNKYHRRAILKNIKFYSV
jgi:hypothetical protein